MPSLCAHLRRNMSSHQRAQPLSAATRSAASQGRNRLPVSMSQCPETGPDGTSCHLPRMSTSLSSCSRSCLWPSSVLTGINCPAAGSWKTLPMTGFCDPATAWLASATSSSAMSTRLNAVALFCGSVPACKANAATLVSAATMPLRASRAAWTFPVSFLVVQRDRRESASRHRHQQLGVCQRNHRA